MLTDVDFRMAEKPHLSFPLHNREGNWIKAVFTYAIQESKFLMKWKSDIYQPFRNRPKVTYVKGLQGTYM